MERRTDKVIQEDRSRHPRATSFNAYSIMKRRICSSQYRRILIVIVGALILLLFISTTLLSQRYAEDYDVDLKVYVPDVVSHPDHLPPPSSASPTLPFEQFKTAAAPSIRDYSKEVYVTLLAPEEPLPWTQGKPDYYFEACKSLIHRILRNTTTRDPHNRPFIVLATHAVPQKQLQILRTHGAQVRIVDTLEPPTGTVNFEKINPRYKDQFTKLLVWNMTEFERIAYFDSDALPIRPVHDIFEVPVQHRRGEEWLFAAVYDSGDIRRDGQRNEPGREDTGVSQNPLNAGVFVLKPTRVQYEYIFSMFKKPPKKDFTTFMEQDLLRWAYQSNGPYPWVRLPHLYNTQWCMKEDLDSAYVLHDKLWSRDADDALREAWYQAWGEMIGWEAAQNQEGIDYLLPQGI